MLSRLSTLYDLCLVKVGIELRESTMWTPLPCSAPEVSARSPLHGVATTVTMPDGEDGNDDLLVFAARRARPFAYSARDEGHAKTEPGRTPCRAGGLTDCRATLTRLVRRVDCRHARHFHRNSQPRPQAPRAQPTQGDRAARAATSTSTLASSTTSTASAIVSECRLRPTQTLEAQDYNRRSCARMMTTYDLCVPYVTSVSDSL